MVSGLRNRYVTQLCAACRHQRASSCSGTLTAVGICSGDKPEAGMEGLDAEILELYQQARHGYATSHRGTHANASRQTHPSYPQPGQGG